MDLSRVDAIKSDGLAVHCATAAARLFSVTRRFYMDNRNRHGRSKSAVAGFQPADLPTRIRFGFQNLQVAEVGQGPTSDSAVIAKFPVS
jgi:hypothetical protein